MSKIIDSISSPDDMKKLNVEELKLLAADAREGILNRVTQVGWHTGPNLAMVETTIAMHYVFNSPIDKFVFDVSHQSYTHKMLTGRKHGYFDENYFDIVSGYTAPEESDHDHFKIGHTSTGISLACGLAKARDLKKETSNIVAIVGDGSLGGGEALEGLNFASELNSNLIIVVNDNKYSIAENHGGLYKNLKELRDTNGTAQNNIFKAIGLDYEYVADGHNVEDLITTFNKVKDSKTPVVVHVSTTKGKGYKFAEENPEAFHANSPFDKETGVFVNANDKSENFYSVTIKYLLEKIKKDKTVVAVNAGTPASMGFSKEVRETMGENFVDVGIMEEHAIAMSSALAKGGCKPVFFIHSPFVLRICDQLSHDLALNNNSAVMVISWNGISSNEETHQGSFDIAMIANIPNVVFLAPTTRQEYLAMLDWAVDQNDGPVVIRQPLGFVEASGEVRTNYDDINKFSVDEKGKDVAIIGLGHFYHLGKEVCEKLKVEGLTPTLINPQFASSLDEDLLESLKENHKVVVTLEDGVLDGGFGEKIARFYGDSNMKVLCRGGFKEFTDRMSLDFLYNRYGLTKGQIVEDVLGLL
ncbi:MAG: 1-deoxy-D-xylulose-5-phosphate synthase [Alphaproteobacteria bacterium]